MPQTVPPKGLVAVPDLGVADRLDTAGLDQRAALVVDADHAEGRVKAEQAGGHPAEGDGVLAEPIEEVDRRLAYQRVRWLALRWRDAAGQGGVIDVVSDPSSYFEDSSFAGYELCVDRLSCPAAEDHSSGTNLCSILKH
jgi:hypothetical protein